MLLKTKKEKLSRIRHTRKRHLRLLKNQTTKRKMTRRMTAKSKVLWQTTVMVGQTFIKIG